MSAQLVIGYGCRWMNACTIHLICLLAQRISARVARTALQRPYQRKRFIKVAENANHGPMVVDIGDARPGCFASDGRAGTLNVSAADSGGTQHVPMQNSPFVVL